MKNHKIPINMSDFHDLFQYLEDTGEATMDEYQIVRKSYLRGYLHGRYGKKPEKLLTNTQTLALAVLGIVMSVGLLAYGVVSLGIH